MTYFKRAFLWTRADWKLASLLPRDVVPIVLLSVAAFTEVSVAPAIPLSSIAAELALELYIVKAVFFAVLDSSLDSFRRALRTDKFLLFVRILILFLVHLAILETAKVRSLTFEAFIVCQLKEAEVLKLVVVGVSRIL